MPTEEEACRQEILRNLQQLLRDLEVITRLLGRLVDAYESPVAAPSHSAMTQDSSAGSGGAERDLLQEVTESFTERESQVFRLLLTGMSNRQIGRSLGIAERTVKNNLHAIYRKLGVAGRTEAVSRLLGTSVRPEPGPGLGSDRRR
nr:hypothetical protein StreXyl84_14610 [Streptomyces sp. Xyl84]